MSRKIKKSFERLQKVAVLALCVVFSWSCQNRNEADLHEPLSDELISFNLSESGNIDPELLIGEWDCVKFAYTADGKKISNVVAISQGRLTIPNEPFIENIEDIGSILNDWEKDLNFRWHFSCRNWQ